MSSVLYLTPGVFDKGGISRYNRFQIRALREKFGEESIRVFSLMGRVPDDLEGSFNVAFSGAMPLSTGSRALYSFKSMREAFSSRPKIVLCALVNMGPLAFAISRATGAKLVQNIYGLEIWNDIGLTMARKAALRRADFVISDCHNTADRAVELGLATGRPDVVWDCVDTERYSSEKVSWPAVEKYGLFNNGKIKLMFLGRVTKDARYKGFERLLRVLLMLPADRFEAVVCGKGDDLGHVKNLALDLGISDRTTITGAIHEDDMPDVYRSADAFYLVSEVGPGMGEGIPLTPMEAMACGVPVLVGNQDGSRELLDGEGGWCGAPGDLKGQRAYLARLAASPEFHDKEKLAARRRAESVFGYERFARETVAAIEKVLPVRNAKGRC